MRRIGISRWLSLLGAGPLAISLGLSLFLLPPAVSAQMEVDRTAHTQQGEGRCIIATKGGEFLYARWACTGKPGEGCGGLFTITGGTGKFSKASGLSLFWMRSTVAEVVITVPGKDVTATFTGQVLWELLQYITP
jgi:hypothetical protein